jgi:hypothetical protein
MSVALADEMRIGLRELAGGGDNVKARITKAARKLGMKPSRAHEIWYGRARRIDAYELEAVRAARQEHKQAAIRTELAEVYRRLEAVEARLAGKAAGRAGALLGEEV